MDILIVDRHFRDYAAQLRPEFPHIRFHAFENAGAALPDCGRCEAVIALAHEISNGLVEAMPKLRWIAALTTGTDHLTTLESLRGDVIITSARGIHGPQMAEMAFLYMIALSRNFTRMQNHQRNQIWERWPQRLLLGKRVTIVGVGTISEEIAVRCKAFGMSVTGVTSARSAARGFDELVSRDKLAHAVADADFVIALVPYEPATHHLIGGDILAAMKPESILINLARGNVVDEKALIKALSAGTIAGAGLDVFASEPLPASSPLWSMDNVIVTPHVGGMSDVYVTQVLPLVAGNIRAFSEGHFDAMRNLVANRSN